MVKRKGSKTELEKKIAYKKMCILLDEVDKGLRHEKHIWLDSICFKKKNLSPMT